MEDKKFWTPTRREMISIAVSFLALPTFASLSRIAHAKNLKNNQKNKRAKKSKDAEETKEVDNLIITDQLSPLNRKRPLRPSTRYIVLHTTEGEDEGSLSKLVRFGEAHYFISSAGKVYRIIDKSKIAKHAGRSMWEGRSTIDNCSIGIEVSGYHNKDIEDAQYESLRILLKQLKSFYSISDVNVLTHSMVAYGRPNRFHDDNHRGRKRCGMLFARSEVRERLGLKESPQHDPDVEAGRLNIGDKELFSYLFKERSEPVLVATNTRTTPAPAPASSPSLAQAPASKTNSVAERMEIPPESPLIALNRTAWQIARERYDRPSTIYVFPDGKRLNGSQIQDWGRIPTGTRVIIDENDDSQPFEGFLEIGKDGDTPQAIAGKASASATTIYFFPNGLIRTGAELKNHRSNRKLFKNPPKGTHLLVGYVYGGYVRSHRPPSSIAGEKWNYPSTYYRYPDGSILNGDDITEKAVPGGTLVFYQQ
jgi:N-acetyl-anhydromuramyl-L-alanine amidase AmpD